jgi:hypothetical protein
MCNKTINAGIAWQGYLFVATGILKMGVETSFYQRITVRKVTYDYLKLGLMR